MNPDLKRERDARQRLAPQQNPNRTWAKNLLDIISDVPLQRVAAVGHRSVMSRPDVQLVKVLKRGHLFKKTSEEVLKLRHEL